MNIARLRQGEEVFFAQYCDGSYYRIKGGCFCIQSVAKQPLSGEFTLLAPAEPSKIVALGVNYRKHAQEMSLTPAVEPLLFLIPPSAILPPGGTIEIARPEHRTDYEAELAVIIGRTCKNITREQAQDYILGYTCANDVSDRTLQKKDGQWARAKGFDTYCPLGPHIVTQLSPHALTLETLRNGEVVQSGNTSEMIAGVFEAVAFISRVMTLLPGDVILTGTPDGIGPITAGDIVEIRIEGIGSLVNFVV